MSNLYVVIARDAPGVDAIRNAERPAHFAYTETILDRIAIAGPLTDGGRFTGSIFIFHADDEAGARALLEAHPYHKAGVWADITVERFTAVAGDWIGGKIW